MWQIYLDISGQFLTTTNDQSPPLKLNWSYQLQLKLVNHAGMVKLEFFVQKAKRIPNILTVSLPQVYDFFFHSLCSPYRPGLLTGATTGVYLTKTVYASLTASIYLRICLWICLWIWIYLFVNLWKQNYLSTITCFFMCDRVIPIVQLGVRWIKCIQVLPICCFTLT